MVAICVLCFCELVFMSFPSHCVGDLVWLCICEFPLPGGYNCRSWCLKYLSKVQIKYSCFDDNHNGDLQFIASRRFLCVTCFLLRIVFLCVTCFLLRVVFLCVFVLSTRNANDRKLTDADGSKNICDVDADFTKSRTRSSDISDLDFQMHMRRK